MELKDKLKQLRKDKGLTQAQLAETLFVSRSMVAKWENGLCLPTAETMAALESLYQISQADLATAEPETVIVAKNRRLRLLGSIIGWTLLLALVVLMYMLPFALHKGNYGFFPEMAAGVFADNTYFDTGDYRIYYSLFDGEWDDGRHWYLLSSFRPVEKHFWGCTVREKDYESDIILHNLYMVGRIYSIEGKHGYYNLLKFNIGAEAQDTFVTLQSVSIDGVEYPVEQGVFFITPEPVKYFEIGDLFLDVE